MIITLGLSIFLILAILYLYLTKNYKYWQKRGIPCEEGAVPGFGHFWKAAIAKGTLSECIKKIYDSNQNRSMVGIYYFTSPTLLIREPELVKTVLQTNFANFHENGIKINPEMDPLLANNPFFNYGEKWITGRKRLTYAFSSMRLKILLETVKQVCKTFENYLDKKMSKTGKVELELKDLFAKFTAQVVSSAGFGVDGMCFDEDKKETFYTTAKTFLDPGIFNTIIFTTIFFFPTLAKILNISFIPKKADRYFREIIKEVIEQRRKETTPRNDFLQLMVDLERSENNKFDLDVLTSHAVSFFVDGYETSSTVLSFIVYHLAAHRKVQERLREEVVSVLSKYNGELTYEALRDMTYMDQVLNESQRVVSTIGLQDKVCTEDTELIGSDGIVCRVERGTHIIIPVDGLHKDPKYWENPTEFDPDRFGPEAKNNIERFTFLPFGEGPRMCVGMRMAQLQIKACLSTFMKKYSVELSPKMKLPLKLIPASVLVAAEGGLWAIIRKI